MIPNHIKKNLPISLTHEMEEKLVHLVDTLKRWNTKHNMVSPADLEQIWERHILDSMMPLKFEDLLQTKEWIDFGSGTGFPLIPLAIILPDCQFIGIEPREKRVLILRQLVRELKLPNVKIHCGQSETYSLPHSVGVCSARAVGSLNEDWPRAQYLIHQEGCFITFKTKNDLILDGKNGSVCYLPYQLPENPMEYFIVRVSHG